MRLRKNTHLEHSGRLLYTLFLNGISLSMNETLCRRTGMPCDEAEATHLFRTSGFPQSTPRVMVKATGALIGTLA